MSGRYHFRCPSCMSVLTVDLRLAGTAAPCPLCAALIVAPQPMAQGIPLANHLAAHPSPFIPAEAPGPDTKTKSSFPHKVVLADSCISQAHLDKKDSAATLRMLLWIVLTLGACAVTAYLLMRS